jgi:vacuolar-type H+-ATPase subunit H
LRADAKAAGDQLVVKAAQKLLEEAQKRVDDLNVKADTQAKQIIQKAADNAKF